ncbi:MAG: Stk1 family PASTA domain-containing Ser/Thr kinase [Lachnospiraceae bacterium]|nr:Stk1 family PASTA domain-containing Ser/Thr kinase [Lachnospiraceae bacterium]
MLKTGMFLGDRYEILELTGSGGMAEVYKAKCHKLNRLVAIKVLKEEFCNDKNFVSKFKAEAQAAAGLSHPNIVGIYDVGDEGELHYIVMELVEGITLKQYIEKKKKLDIKESIGIAIQIAQGIGAAHEQHIIHRDIKPQNVIISRDGKVKVTDFGIAKIASSQTINSEAVGSVYYFSPEQARGGYCDERSDIYSLGITLYEMLTGQVPFDGESTVAVALSHLQSEMKPPREIDPMIPISLEKIIMKATMKKPERRYASAQELISDLRKALLMPEEDFVKVIPVNNTSPTVLISEDEISLIKQSKTIPISETETGETAQGERADYDVEEITDPDEEDEEEESTVFDKIVFIAGIVVCVLIICLAGFLLAKAIKNWSSNKPDETSSAETTTSAVIDIPSTVSDKQTTVPSVVGKTYDEAVAILKASSLGVKRSDMSSEEIDEGVVISQQYPSGTVVDKNISVILYVSSGSAMITLPADSEMVGKLAANVKRNLRALGLEVVENTEYSKDVPEKMVISVKPEGGTKVNPGSTVTIVTSLGAEIEYIYVPDLRKMTVDEADDYLDSTLTLVVEYAYSDGTDYKIGEIMSQQYEVNSRVEKGSEIKVVVSKGKEFVEIPDLLKMTKEEAVDAIKAAGLAVGKISEDYSDKIEEKLVCKYEGVDTNSEGYARIGSKVNITLSLGKEFAIVPDIVDMTKEKAIEALEKAGLEAGNITEEYSDLVKAGRVISQGTDADVEVKIGSKVNFVVSTGVEYIDLPHITGRPYKEVKKELEDLGFEVVLEEEISASAEDGYVIRCNYANGSSAPKGSKVKLTYAVKLVAQSMSATVASKTRYIGESLTRAEFTVTVVMSDGSTRTNPDGWDFYPAELLGESNEITVVYGSLSTIVKVAAEKKPEPVTEEPTPEETTTQEPETESAASPETDPVESESAEAEGSNG